MPVVWLFGALRPLIEAHFSDFQVKRDFMVNTKQALLEYSAVVRSVLVTLML